MSHKFSRLAVCVLALLTTAASYNVATARAQTPGKKTLVSTECKQGTITVCGEEPAHYECTRTWKLDLGWLTQTFGFGIGEVTCTQVGRVSLYKDKYFDGKTIDRCYLPKPNGDVAPTKHSDEDAPSEPYSDESEEC